MRRALPVLLLVFVSACSKDKAPSSEETASMVPIAGASATAPATPWHACQYTNEARRQRPAPGGLHQPGARPTAQRSGANQRGSGEQGRVRTGSVGNRTAERVAGASAERDRIFRGLLDQMIAAKLLAQESGARKVAVPDAEVEARRCTDPQSFSVRGSLHHMLVASEKFTLEQLESDASEHEINKMLEAEIGAKIAVTATKISPGVQGKSRQRSRCRSRCAPATF